MSSSHSHTPPATPPATARQRRTLLVTAVIAAVFVIGGGIAAACIPWTGKFELENTDANGDVDNQGDENGVAVYGADHSDVEKDGTTGGDRGNGQGMVWCDEDDPNGFGQQYKWAEVHPSNIDTDGTPKNDPGVGDGIVDIKLTVDDNNDHTNDNGNDLAGSDDTGGCDSDLYLPEDEYSITFDEDSFDNEDDSTANGEETYADNHDSDSNGGSAEVGKVGTSSHCMDTDTNADDDASKGTHEIYWDLTEDEGSHPDGSEFDGGDDVDTNRFTSNNDDAPSDGTNRDVIDEGPHSKDVDFDVFDYDANDSGDDSDSDGHTDAAGICITSHEHFEHDNDDVDDDDSEVEGGNKDDDGSGDFPKEYGNAIPVNVLNSV